MSSWWRAQTVMYVSIFFMDYLATAMQSTVNKSVYGVGLTVTPSTIIALALGRTSKGLYRRQFRMFFFYFGAVPVVWIFYVTWSLCLWCVNTHPRNIPVCSSHTWLAYFFALQLCISRRNVLEMFAVICFCCWNLNWQTMRKFNNSSSIYSVCSFGIIRG